MTVSVEGGKISYQVDVRLCGDLTVKHGCEVYKSKKIQYNTFFLRYEQDPIHFRKPWMGKTSWKYLLAVV